MDLNEEHQNLYIPQWFEKEHFEEFLGSKLSDKQFQKIKEYLIEGSYIADKISNEVREELGYLKKDKPKLFKK